MELGKDEGKNKKVPKTPVEGAGQGDGDEDCEDSSEIKELQKIKQPVDSRGMPISTFNVPGVSRKPGTPTWARDPAAAATRKAK
jgi:hypothetical protein